jgi:SAM-dependent methyltransferase
MTDFATTLHEVRPRVIVCRCSKKNDYNQEADMSGYQLSGNAPAAYVRYATHVMAPWTGDLISQAQCVSGDRVLDLACGTGFVSSQVSPGCKITGIDVNEAMLAVARQNTAIEWHSGSAIELPFPDGSFDVVLCQQGLQYFPDRLMALREIARVLSPGGRVSLNVWGPIERQPFHAALLEAIILYLGDEHKAVFDLAFSLNTAQELHALADAADLKDVRVRFEHRTIRHPDPSELLAGFMTSTPIAGQFLALSESDRGSFVKHAADYLAPYVDDAGLASPMENHFLFATC